MTSKRILVTGASGCIGHYVTEALIQETKHELYLFIRNPNKLAIDVQARPGVHLICGDLRHIEQFQDLLQTIDTAILIATAWGGPQEVYDINVDSTLRLVKLLSQAGCEHIIYFSTASILDHENRLLTRAGEIGTDYIRSKYVCHQRLQQLAIAPRLTTLFPTLVFGGDATGKPYSHISQGIPLVSRWVGILRFLRADGSFHFIHGKDIAQIVHYLVEHPPATSQDLVLGNDRITVNQAIEAACEYMHKRIYFRIPLTLGLANVIIKLFRIKMAAWDRFSMEYRHFTHKQVVSPATFGLPTYCATMADILKLHGIHPRR